MYGPYRFSIMKRDDAKEVYASVQKIMVFVMLACGLGVILLSKDILIIMATPSFYVACKPIPYLVMGIVCNGAYYLYQTGIYLEKKTQYISMMVTAAALINLLANLVLVPGLGMVGAAQARCLSYLSLAVMTYFVSQKIYEIDYDFQANLVMLVSGFVLWVVSGVVLVANLWLRVTINVLLLLAYSVAMIRLFFGKLNQLLAPLSRKLVVLD
jgi:O-antigen/teichoic acid export membrane protein